MDGGVRELLCYHGTGEDESVGVMPQRTSLMVSQVYVVVAAGTVIAFIIRDLGDPSIAGWIIQGEQNDGSNSRQLARHLLTFLLMAL